MSQEEEFEKNKKGTSSRRLVTLLIKILITIACFWYITTKIDFTQALQAITKANWAYLLAALLFFILSKLLSAFRLNINFRNINLRLSEWKNIKLYWLGMFYNLFLPGAISGDAYKVILLKRRYKVSYKKASSAVLLDRFSGVLALGIILAVYGFLVLGNRLYGSLLLVASLSAIVIFYLAVRFIFRDFLPGVLLACR